MKKSILSLALVATIIGSIAAGCSSSEKATGGSDSTKMDSTKSMSAPADTGKMKTDTMKRDTTKTPPM